MPKTLLLADDSVVIQKLVGLSFANEDVKLITTDNGNDAITMARERRPDIVLADVVMPGRSGYEVCEAIKRDPELAHIPVILLTGTFEAFDEARAQAAGSNGHITKPFEAQALVERVGQLLREAAAAPPPPAQPSPDDLELFDGGDSGIGHDVTRAAPPPPIGKGPQPTAARRDPLSADDGFDFGADVDLPSIDADDPLAGPLDLGDAPSPGEPTVALVPETADDDWLATSPSALQGRSAAPAAIRPPPIPVTDVTPPLATPPPVPTAPAAPSSLAMDDSLADGSDPSLTTIIMSEGDRSSDGLALGDAAPRVRSLDDEPTAEPAAAERTMLADDLFAEPVRSDDSDSAFDFGAGALTGASTAAPASSLGRPEPDALLDSDPFALPASRSPRSGPPDLASRYDVSTSELIEDDDEPADDATMFAPVGEDFTSAPSTGSEIELTDGLLGEPLGLDDDGPQTSPPSPGGDVAGRTPDITPVMRDRIHDTLERVAWDAFADLPETLIKQVVERVEAIAWEVIPQMAETLIKDEIRRMKGEDESD